MKMPLSKQQEIQDYLDGLNRICQSWQGGRESAAARQLGISNYFKWFKERDIALVETNGHVWKLVEDREQNAI